MDHLDEEPGRLRYDAELELLWARVDALEKRVNESKMMMRRPGHLEYEKLVDIICDHEERLNSLGG